MASVAAPSMPPALPSAEDQLAAIRYVITTTSPARQRHDEQQELDNHKGSQSTNAPHESASHNNHNDNSNSDNFDKQKEQQQQQHDKDHPKDVSANITSNNSNNNGTPAASHAHSPDYDKEDVCHRLHPSLQFIPIDKEHPPRPITPSPSPVKPASLSNSRPSTPARSPSHSRSRSLSASPTPSPSPNLSPSGSPGRVSQRQQKKAMRAELAAHRAADDCDVKMNAADKAPSKLQLLAPPPINSQSNNRRNSNTRSRSPSPTPSPSPPPSPYLSPSHPRRRGSFSTAINSVFPVSELMTEMAPSRIGRHPLVLYPAIFCVTLLLALPVLGLPLSSPLSAVVAGLKWCSRNIALVSGVMVVVLSALGVMWRRAVLAVYRTVFLPPAGASLPRPFSFEEIDLTSDKWAARVADWAQQIDANSTIEEESDAATSAQSPSPSPIPASPSDNHRRHADAAVDAMRGLSMLALMQSYQRGQLDDCTFVCLRAFLSDSTMNHSGDGDDTVALVFISIKNHYDLSPYLLRLLTPVQACFPFLCAPALLSHTIRRWMSFRFAVIGFHWPFRSCIAFTKPVSEFASYLQLSQQPIAELTAETDEKMRIHIARLTSILRLVQDWDMSHPKGKQSDFMLFPVLSSSPVVDAIIASGGSAVPILPTYVVDLRSVKGGEWQDFKRHLRKAFNRKVREGPFEGAGGSTEVTNGEEVTEEQAKELCRLWHQVADYRGNKDQTACLMEPNPVFVQELAHHPARFIQLLELKLKDVTVAASLLFSLSPTVMTSDIAGFNYPALEAASKEANHQIKAYPVKLAAVVKAAISGGYEWVDFGPTTGASKMELGAREIPITGGLFYHGTITSLAVKAAACCLSRQHTVARKAYD